MGHRWTQVTDTCVEATRAATGSKRSHSESRNACRDGNHSVAPGIRWQHVDLAARLVLHGSKSVMKRSEGFIRLTFPADQARQHMSAIH